MYKYKHKTRVQWMLAVVIFALLIYIIYEGRYFLSEK